MPYLFRTPYSRVPYLQVWTALLNNFSTKIADHGSEAAAESFGRENRDEDESGEDDGNTKEEDKKSAASRDTDIMTADCDTVLDFLQAVAVKAPRLEATPLSLRADKRARDWFHKWSTHPRHCRTSRSLRNHRSTEKCFNLTPKLRSPLPRFHGTMQGRKGEEGVGQPTPNGPTSHPSGKCIRWHHHTVNATNIYPLLLQPVQHNRSAGGFCPDLHRAKYLPANILL